MTVMDPHDVVERYDVLRDAFPGPASPLELWASSVRRRRCALCGQVGISLEHFMGHLQETVDELNEDKPEKERVFLDPGLRYCLMEIELQVDLVHVLIEVRDELHLFRESHAGDAIGQDAAAIILDEMKDVIKEAVDEAVEPYRRKGRPLQARETSEAKSEEGKGGVKYD